MYEVLQLPWPGDPPVAVMFNLSFYPFDLLSMACNPLNLLCQREVCHLSGKNVKIPAEMAGFRSLSGTALGQGVDG